MIAEMAARGTPFIGLLYAGLALTNTGIKVIEFNARFGDPETEVLIPRLVTPLAQLLYKAATDCLDDVALQWSDESAVTVVLAASGYPNTPRTKDLISKVPSIGKTQIFHAGTLAGEKGLLSNGGRVMAVTGTGKDLTEARDRAYRAISQIELDGSFYRSDIALNASVAEKGN
jgi:phosphoribosylamine--glycine ligase